MTEKFDVIIVGAGPAGCAAAYEAARKGLNVLVLERGEYPGAKNMSGAILYSRGLADFLPEFWQEAPVERTISQRKLVFMSGEATFALDSKDNDFARPPYNGFSILRSKFDPWLSQKAEHAGALIMPGAQVDELLWRDRRVTGVRTRLIDGEVQADAVILAEGANALLTQKSGLGGKPSSRDMSLGIKEIIKLPAEIINQRFNLNKNEGAALNFVGDCTNGIEGGAFLFTNRESVSLGMVCKLSGLVEREIKISELFEEFKERPPVKELIRGGTAREYSAHMIPEGGYKKIPRLVAGGLLVAGEAAFLNFNNGFILRGIDFAIASGIAAARTVINAKANRDFSKAGLVGYRKELENSFILQDMKRFRRMPQLLSNPRIYSTYPDLLCRLGRDLFQVDWKQRKRVRTLFKENRQRLGSEAGITGIIRDAFRLGRNV